MNQQMRVFRVESTVASNAMTGVVLGGASVLLGLLETHRGNLAFGVLAVLAAVVFLALAYRYAKMGAYVEESCLVVRNPLRTHRLEWNSITGFRFLSTTTAWVYLEGGRKIPIWGMSCYPMGKSYVPLISMIDELRAVASEHRTDG
jgi:hypothetical protein